jgi:hypothetical protein
VTRARSIFAACAAFVAVGSLLADAPGVAAAPPPFQIVTDTTYEVRPADRSIHVTVVGRGTSFQADTATTRFFYDTAVVVVLGGGTNFTASANGGPAAVGVLEESATQIALEVDLNRSVFYRQTGTFRLEFDLASDAADGEVRVGANVAAFPVWAVGTPETAGSSVTISIPPDFELDVEGEALPEPTPRGDGGELFRWGPLADPIDFSPYAIADLPLVTEGTYLEVVTSVELPSQEVTVTVRAWADDPDWGDRVSEQITTGLPVLNALIGLDYIGTPDLRVEETVPRSIGGYAGIFDAGLLADRIAIAYDASDGVTLHEAAHAWFNGALASERWILEGFASLYAELAAGELGVAPDQIELTAELRESAYPLVRWGQPGIEERNAELFAYGASLEAARQIHQRAGAEAMASVWTAMHASQMAYQSPLADEPETWFATNPDWRHLLDLLEEATGEPFVDIMTTWVSEPAADATLALRADARAGYADLLDQADDWALPTALRRDLSAWAFDEVTEHLEDADPVLDRRDELRPRAAVLDLTLPDSMREQFQAGDYGDAGAIGRDLDAALAALEGADAADGGEDVIEWLGLLGSDPDARLGAARSAFEAGELDEATAQADAAAELWSTATDAGTGRVALASGGLAVLLVGLGGGAILMRRRRVAPPPPPPPAAPPPYSPGV